MQVKSDRIKTKLLKSHVEMERQKFQSLVQKAIEALPSEFRSKLDNIEIIIEDWPSPLQCSQLGIKDKKQLLGLYEGVPQINRGGTYNLVLPDKITIFQKPIEAKCHTSQEIEKEIINVVRHEIAHHFGLSDTTLRKIERQKTKK